VEKKLHVKWMRPHGSTNGTAEPHYRYEGEPIWKSYTTFPNRPADIGMSKGMTTFQMWLKLGAVIEQGVGVL
jgi:hypothetical protein